VSRHPPQLKSSPARVAALASSRFGCASPSQSLRRRCAAQHVRMVSVYPLPAYSLSFVYPSLCLPRRARLTHCLARCALAADLAPQAHPCFSLVVALSSPRVRCGGHHHSSRVGRVVHPRDRVRYLARSTLIVLVRCTSYRDLVKPRYLESFVLINYVLKR
jgi:hypothetical protein